MEQDRHVERLRAHRARMEAIDSGLEHIRRLEDTLQRMRQQLRELRKVEQRERDDEILSAADDRVPKITIAREVGLTRAVLYGILQSKSVDS